MGNKVKAILQELTAMYECQCTNKQLLTILKL